MGDLSEEELRARLKYAMGELRCAPFVQPLRELQRHRADRSAAAKNVREVVRSEMRLEFGSEYEVVVDAIADRIAEQLTASPPGHVCPVPYGLGPEDLDVLEDLADMVTRDDIATETAGSTRTSAVLDKILAAHRPPGVRS